MKYAVNEAGVEALSSAAASIRDSIDEIKSITAKMRALVDEYNQLLGPHKESLEEALLLIESSINGSTDPASVVSERLNAVAGAYEVIIANDLFTGINYVDSEEGDSQKTIGALVKRR